MALSLFEQELLAGDAHGRTMRPEKITPWRQLEMFQPDIAQRLMDSLLDIAPDDEQEAINFFASTGKMPPGYHTRKMLERFNARRRSLDGVSPPTASAPPVAMPSAPPATMSRPQPSIAPPQNYRDFVYSSIDDTHSALDESIRLNEPSATFDFRSPEREVSPQANVGTVGRKETIEAVDRRLAAPQARQPDATLRPGSPEWLRDQRAAEISRRTAQDQRKHNETMRQRRAALDAVDDGTPGTIREAEYDELVRDNPAAAGFLSRLPISNQPALRPRTTRQQKADAYLGKLAARKSAPATVTMYPAGVEDAHTPTPRTNIDSRPDPNYPEWYKESPQVTTETPLDAEGKPTGPGKVIRRTMVKRGIVGTADQLFEKVGRGEPLSAEEQSRLDHHRRYVADVADRERLMNDKRRELAEREARGGELEGLGMTPAEFNLLKRRDPKAALQVQENAMNRQLEAEKNRNIDSYYDSGIEEQRLSRQSEERRHSERLASDERIAGMRPDRQDEDPAKRAKRALIVADFEAGRITRAQADKALDAVDGTAPANPAPPQKITFGDAAVTAKQAVEDPAVLAFLPNLGTMSQYQIGKHLADTIDSLDSKGEAGVANDEMLHRIAQFIESKRLQDKSWGENPREPLFHRKSQDRQLAREMIDELLRLPAVMKTESLRQLKTRRRYKEQQEGDEQRRKTKEYFDAPKPRLRAMP